MKIVVASAVALLLGLLLGGYGPRAELQAARKELDGLRQELAEAKRDRGLPLAMGLGNLLAASRAVAEAETPRPAAPVEKARPATPAPAAKDDDEGDDPDDDDEGVPDGGARGRGAGLGDPQAFGMMRAAMALRSSQYRQRFSEAARLDSAKEARLDEVIGGMNQQIAAEADRLAGQIAGLGQAPSHRQFIDAVVGFAQVYQRADDRLQLLLDAHERAAAATTRFDLLNQIDVGSFQHLAEVLAGIQERTPEPQP